jgi:hypothetical protein
MLLLPSKAVFRFAKSGKNTCAGGSERAGGQECEQTAGSAGDQAGERAGGAQGRSAAVEMQEEKRKRARSQSSTRHTFAPQPACSLCACSTHNAEGHVPQPAGGDALVEPARAELADHLHRAALHAAGLALQLQPQLDYLHRVRRRHLHEARRRAADHLLVQPDAAARAVRLGEGLAADVVDRQL